MTLLVLLILACLLLGGFGFALHALWFVLLAVVVIALIGYALRT